MEEKKNIFQRMSAITKEISAVAKNLQVGTGKNQYKAVGEADVLAAVKPIEEKYGVYSYPISREIVESGTMERENQYGKTIQLYMRIKTVYRFICIDNPDSYIDIVSFADGVDTNDKAPGKAMTYADKYALLKAYKIITGDDPDQFASEPANKVESKPAPKTAKEKMNAAYPDRAGMIAFIKNNYDEANLKKILDYYKVTSVEALTTEQIIVCYNKKKRQ